MIGIVRHGKAVGRTLGFPTANLSMTEALSGKPNGVYVARVRLLAQGGRAYFGVLNLGVHPTLPEGEPTVEIHLFNFDGDLYGERVSVEFLAFLRPETRFDSAQALSAQVAKDVQNARAWLAEHETAFRQASGKA